MPLAPLIAAVLLLASPVLAQTTTNDPFPTPIAATEGVIKVNFVEFASLPDLGDPMPARMMLLVDEPGTQRLFVNDMRGPLYTLSRDGKAVKLTSHEFRLLAYLMHHNGRVVSRTELVEHLYDQDFDRDSNTIEVFIGRLRKKIPGDIIQTVRGLGYRLSQDGDEA